MDRMWIEHGNEVRMELDGILKSGFELESAVRGYELSQKKNVAETYIKAKQKLYAHIDSVLFLTSDQPVQVKRINRIQTLVNARIKLLEKVNSKEFEKETDILVIQGDAIMDRIRELVMDMRTFETQLLAHRIRSASFYKVSMYVIIPAFSLITLLVLIFGYRIIGKENDKANKADAQKKMAMTVLKEGEERYRNLFEHSIDPIFIADDKWIFGQVNHSFDALINIPLNDNKPESMEGLFESPHDYFRFTSEVEAKGFVRNYSTRFTIDSNVHHVLLSALRLDAKGKTTGYQGIIHDITQLKKAEEEVILADKLSFSGKVARMMAHEVRNPLTNIGLAIGEIKEVSQPDGEGAMYLDIIERNAHRINELINALLENTRITELHFEEKNIVNVIQSAVAFCDDRLKMRNTHVEIRAEQLTVPNVKIDEEKIVMSLTNIMLNAIEAMQEAEKPMLSIVASTTEEDRCKVSVTDNGKGMDKETLVHLFHPFYSKRSGGMGLGMASTQYIIQKHGGSITAQSEPGLGTTIHMVI